MGIGDVRSGLGDQVWADILRTMVRTYAELVDYQEQHEQRNAELTHLRHFLSSIMVSISDYLVVADKHGTITDASGSFCDYADAAWDIPDDYYAHRYYLSAHGCGMTGEYHYLHHRGDFPDAGYDGEIKPGMTLCVESFIGEEGRGEGVKLERQVLITETGIELLSRFPSEAALLE